MLPAEVAGVTFSDAGSTTVPKFLNLGPAILQIWESDSCSDSGYNHRSNRNLPMFLPKKWLHRLLLLPKWKSESGFVFSQIFDSGSSPAEKRRILPESTPVIRIRSHLWLPAVRFFQHSFISGWKLDAGYGTFCPSKQKTGYAGCQETT